MSARQLWKLLLYAVKCSVDAKTGAVLSRHAGEAGKGLMQGRQAKYSRSNGRKLPSEGNVEFSERFVFQDARIHGKKAIKMCLL